MLSKNQISLVKSLQLGKFREEHRLFIAEGIKLVDDLLQGGFKVRKIFATASWLGRHRDFPAGQQVETLEVQPDELKKISSLVTPNEVLALVSLPEQSPDIGHWTGNLVLLLDRIQDPGNLGTILRTADWFGIRKVFCTEGTTDVFSPKVVQATMGSICRVNVHYLAAGELDVLSQSQWHIYGTASEGENIYTSGLLYPAVIVIGNESKGLSPGIQNILTHRIGIPAFATGAESLNASVAAGIVISEFARRFPEA